MIQLNGKTKLSTEQEKLFVEVGGVSSDKSLSDDELRTALVNTIKVLAQRKSPILLKIYQRYVSTGDLPVDDIEGLLNNFQDKNHQIKLRGDYQLALGGSRIACLSSYQKRLGASNHFLVVGQRYRDNLTTGNNSVFPVSIQLT